MKIRTLAEKGRIIVKIRCRKQREQYGCVSADLNASSLVPT